MREDEIIAGAASPAGRRVETPTDYGPSIVDTYRDSCRFIEKMLDSVADLQSRIKSSRTALDATHRVMATASEVLLAQSRTGLAPPPRNR